MYGDKGKSDQIQLKNESNKFERAQSDLFTIETVDIGRPFKLRIGHNDKKLGSGWHLDTVRTDDGVPYDKYKL